MITESFQEYKGYTIRLKAVTMKGFRYFIFKTTLDKTNPNNVKKIYLKEKVHTFIKPEKLLQEAKDYIDNHEDNLIKKYNERSSKLKQ